MALLQNMTARRGLPPAPEDSAMNMLRADSVVRLFSDLKWRLYQSRRGTQAAASPLGRGRNKADGRMLPGFSSGAAASLRYNSNIPYSSWTQPTDIRVPRCVATTGHYTVAKAES